MSERPEMNWDLHDLERRFGAMVTYGNVVEVDFSAPRARVQSGPIVTDWLPWLTEKAQNDRTWHAPEVGEQVVMIAPHGDLGQACIVGAIHAEDSSARTPPGARPTIDRTVYRDGTVTEYDRSLRVFHLWNPNQITLRAYGQITLVGDVVVDGNLQVNGFIRAEHPIISTEAVWPPNPSTVPRIPTSRRYTFIER